MYLSHVLSNEEIITIIRDAHGQVSDFLCVYVILTAYYTEQFRSLQEHADLEMNS